MTSRFAARVLARRYGRPLAERFWEKVDRRGPDECWMWTASRRALGYGQIRIGGKSRKAHRVAYELANGPIPAGMAVLHGCDNPPCVNPAHLRAGTMTDNVRDMVTRGRCYRPIAGKVLLKPECKNGHAFDADNTRWSADRTRRHCRACHLARNARYRQARAKGSAKLEQLRASVKVTP